MSGLLQNQAYRLPWALRSQQMFMLTMKKMMRNMMMLLMPLLMMILMW